MKYLDLLPLARINTFLDNVDVGDYCVHGVLEAYSCGFLFMTPWNLYQVHLLS